MSDQKKAYLEYLKSPEWAARRKWALERAENRCQVCNSDGPLDVHHRTYERLGNEWPSDLTVLCRDCHGLYHGRMATQEEGDGGGSARPMSEGERQLHEIQRKIEDEEDEDEKLRLMGVKGEIAMKLKGGPADG